MVDRVVDRLARSPRFDPQHHTKLTIAYTHSPTPPGRFGRSKLQLYSKFEGGQLQ